MELFRKARSIQQNSRNKRNHNSVKIKSGIDWEAPDRQPGKGRCKVNEKLRLGSCTKMIQKGTDDGKESDGRNGVAELTA